MADTNLKLWGRIFLEMDIHSITGLRIGGRQAALAIGAVDNPVIRDPITLQPYIPGSSLRGKMRSLWEKVSGSPQNTGIGRGVQIHSLPSTSTSDDHFNDQICRIFGVSGDNSANPNPTRLIVHDTFLNRDSVDALSRTDISLYTETKFEVAIDRVTSAATPRQMERVPAGAVFSGCRMVYNVYNNVPPTKGDEIEWFFDIVTMLQLVEDDYLGSSGSRGSGRVQFQNIRLSTRIAQTPQQYMRPVSIGLRDANGQIISYSSVNDVWNEAENLKSILRSQFNFRSL